MIRHTLYEIDLEKKTAFCCACGITEIHIAKSRTDRVPKVFCLKRWEQLRQAEKERRDEKQRLRPCWKPRHSLSEIDPEEMTAICAVCGRTDIRKHTSKGTTHYRCVAKERAYGRQYRRLHYTARTLSSTAHTLSEIDEEKKTAVCSICGPVEIYVWQGKRKLGRRCSNASVNGVVPAQQIRREANTTLINAYKIGHGCQRCGYNKNPDSLYLHARSPHKNDPKIDKLLKLNRERLIQELNTCDVLCGICRSLGHRDVDTDRQGGEIPVQISHL